MSFAPVLDSLTQVRSTTFLSLLPEPRVLSHIVAMINKYGDCLNFLKMYYRKTHIATNPPQNTPHHSEYTNTIALATFRSHSGRAPSECFLFVLSGCLDVLN